jgi:hypothetical protein
MMAIRYSSRYKAVVTRFPVQITGNLPGSVPKAPQVFKKPVTESHIRKRQYRFPDRIG